MGIVYKARDSNLRRLVAIKCLPTNRFVLTKDPEPIEDIAPNIPKELRRVIGRCLQKDASRRFQSMLDLKLTLEELQHDSDVPRIAGPSTVVTRHRRWWSAFTAIAVCAVLAVLWVWWKGQRIRVRPLNLEQLTFDGGLTTNPAISRGGS